MGIVLLQLTGYGWTGIAIIILSVLIAIKILKRRDRNSRPGCLGVGYVSLVVFCLLFFTVGLGGVLCDFVYKVVTLPRYEARVINYTSFESKDSKNRHRIMYRATVTFNTADGTPVTMESDVASSGKPEIGEIITVGYKPDMERVEELSWSKFLLMGGASVMLLIIGYFAAGGVLYAMGYKMKRYMGFGMTLLLYFIFPLAMLFLFCGMGYALVLYFMGQKPDMPIWAVAICLFFCLVLAGSFFGYARLLMERRGRP
nr:DUF3592 domain-containing protein [uncultured Chitinophaga sp.]